MKTKSYIFAGIIAAITMGNAMATDENTVTSKSYVDARDELKQNKIPATGTNASTPGDTVVTYTSTAGTIGERGIYDSGIAIDKQGQIVSGHEGDLVPASEFVPAVIDIHNDIINNITSVNNSITDVNNSITNMGNSITNITNQMNAQTLESVNVQLPLTCANSCAGLSGDKLAACEAAAGAAGGCTLWEIGSVGIAHKLYSCTAQTVASCPSCGTGTKKACENNICTCNVCKADGASVSNASECCSGQQREGICCGTSGVSVCIDK